jgi:hypothetical protein
MTDSEDEMLLAAVNRFDDAAASLRQSDLSPDQMAGLLCLIADVQRNILVMTGAESKQRNHSPVHDRGSDPLGRWTPR